MFMFIQKHQAIFSVTIINLLIIKPLIIANKKIYCFHKYKIYILCVVRSNNINHAQY